jgi:hypothetical protein
MGQKSSSSNVSAKDFQELGRRIPNLFHHNSKDYSSSIQHERLSQKKRFSADRELSKANLGR